MKPEVRFNGREREREREKSGKGKRDTTKERDIRRSPSFDVA
jgi:hypothetical protein